MTNPCTIIAKKIRGLMNSQNGADIDYFIQKFELMLGMRPFILIYPVNALQPKMQIYPLGLACTCIHLGLFIACCVTSINLYKPNAVVDDQDQLNTMETYFLILLRSLNTFYIFFQVRHCVLSQCLLAFNKYLYI